MTTKTTNKGQTEANLKLIERAKALVTQGKTKPQIKGFLLMEGMSEADAGEALKGLGLTRVMGDFREWLYTELAKGPMTKATFQAQIKGATENARKHESHYWGIVELVNKVHAKVKVAK